MNRILLVDNNQEFTESFTKFYQNQPDYEIYSCSDGKQAELMFGKIHPNVLVMDLILPHKDGLSLLSSVNKKDCKVLVVSSLIQHSLMNKVIEMGADYYMIKPCDMEDVHSKIKMLMQTPSVPVQTHNEIDRQISDFFMVAGIPAHIHGYQFLREAIKISIAKPDIINSITKRLYPEVAQKFNTTPSKVERAIRHAIEVSFNRGKIENLNTLFGIKVYSHNEKPTNGEFIALVADKILLDCI